MSNKTWFNIGVVLLVILSLIMAVKLGSREKDLVYQICTESRVTNNVSEQTCGELQDFYRVEYLCRDNNNSTHNKCWVEQK